jgi:hypothetical protein
MIISNIYLRAALIRQHHAGDTATDKNKEILAAANKNKIAPTHLWLIMAR